MDGHVRAAAVQGVEEVKVRSNALSFARTDLLHRAVADSLSPISSYRFARGGAASVPCTNARPCAAFDAERKSGHERPESKSSRHVLGPIAFFSFALARLQRFSFSASPCLSRRVLLARHRRWPARDRKPGRTDGGDALGLASAPPVRPASGLLPASASFGEGLAALAAPPRARPRLSSPLLAVGPLVRLARLSSSAARKHVVGHRQHRWSRRASLSVPLPAVPSSS